MKPLFLRSTRIGLAIQVGAATSVFAAEVSPAASTSPANGAKFIELRAAVSHLPSVTS